MDSRHAKRYANRHLAQVAKQQADVIEQRYRSGSTWNGLPRRDAVRVVVALMQLHDELSHRGQVRKDRRPYSRPPIPVHPDQVALFEEAPHGV